MVKLLGKTGLVILFAVALSLGIDMLYRRAYGLRYVLPRNILAYPEISGKYEIVKLGNSHADDGLTFERYKIKSLSLSGVAQSFEYDLPMLKMYSRQIKEGAVIIINVSPLSFSQKKPDRDDNVNTNYYDGRLSPFLIPHLKPGDYLQRQIVPFLRAGYLWRETHAQEVAEKAMSTYAEAWKKPKTAPAAAPEPVQNDLPTARQTETTVTNRQPGTASDNLATSYPRSFNPSFAVEEIQAELAAPSEPADAKLVNSAQLIVDKWLRSGDFGTQYFDANRKDLEELIKYSLERKWQPVLITLPISQVLLDDLDHLEGNYLKRYMYDHLDKIDREGIRYFDYASNSQLTKNRYLFSNSDHLNKKGAAIVSYLLLKQLIDAGLVPKTADGYDYGKIK